MEHLEMELQLLLNPPTEENILDTEMREVHIVPGNKMAAAAVAAERAEQADSVAARRLVLPPAMERETESLIERIFADALFEAGSSDAEGKAVVVDADESGERVSVRISNISCESGGIKNAA